MKHSFKRLLSAIHNDEEQARAEGLLDEIYMNLFMNHLRRKHQQARLRLLIDDALDRKDRQAFLKYTTILQETEH